MISISGQHANIERAVEKILGEVFAYCFYEGVENSAIYKGNVSAGKIKLNISAATTLIAHFVEPECTVEDITAIVQEKCVAIGVSLAEIQSAINKSTFKKGIAIDEAIGLYIDGLGDDSTFLSSRSDEQKALDHLHQAEKLLDLPHNYYVLRNDYMFVDGVALSNALRGVGPKPTSGLHARPPSVHPKDAKLSNDQVVALWRLTEVQVLLQAVEFAQEHHGKAGRASVKAFAVRKFISDVGLIPYGGKSNALPGKLNSAIAGLLSIVLPDGVGQDDVKKAPIAD